MIKNILHIVELAGEAILDIYNSSDFSVTKKQDDSPLTLADKESHKIIKKELTKLYPDIPILSEEGRDIPYKKRKCWERFWLIDPLDGTKEFIKRNGEFTVNIALIEDNKPVLGVIYVPDKDLFYFADRKIGAYKLENTAIKENTSTANKLIKLSIKLPLDYPDKPFTVVTSRSHLSKETEDYILRLNEKHKELKIIPRGSSIKICLVAEGSADIYPIFGPTCEWDTAAGHAIINIAGGKIVDVANNKMLKYNKENLINPSFVVYKK